MIERARELRQQPTEAEKVLWDAVRARRLGGYKFRRQYSVDYFIVDFCCPELNLVIEVDGEIHDNQVEYDAERTRILNAFGFHILRFSNHQVLNQLDQVLNSILEVAK